LALLFICVTNATDILGSLSGSFTEPILFFNRRLTNFYVKRKGTCYPFHFREKKRKAYPWFKGVQQ
jgi:hypothetical protein